MLRLVSFMLLLATCMQVTVGFTFAGRSSMITSHSADNFATARRIKHGEIKMNIFEDAFRFFGNMDKEASAKHILIKGPDASEKLSILKADLENAEDVSSAFSELAAKVSECPSANRGGNLGTFKPGMMVKEFDKVCFEKEVGKVHGPVETQFGSHLILVTRRYSGEDEKKSD